MKTNIKMRVTPEQSMKVQNIVITNLNTKNKVATTDIHFPYIVISTMGTFGTRDMEFYKIQNYKEIDADLFIITNGTCEKISDEGLSKIKAASEGKSTEYLQEKIINLHKQINKDRATIKNQKEELHKLNLKLQKCISLEEHNQIIEKINKDNVNYLSNNILSRDKEIEKLKAVIEYLESKVK